MSHLAEEKFGWTSKDLTVLKSTRMVSQMYSKTVPLNVFISESPWQPGTVAYIAQRLMGKCRS